MLATFSTKFAKGKLPEFSFFGYFFAVVFHPTAFTF